MSRNSGTPEQVSFRPVTFEYLRPGKGVSRFRQYLALDQPDLRVLIQPEYSGPNLAYGGALAHQSGTPMVWCIIPGEWIDIGRFTLSDGSFTGWYTNICTPARFERPGTLKSTDLFLDHWLPASGTPTWLDQDEYQAALSAGMLSEAQRQQVGRERSRIESLVERNEWPPAQVRSADLEGLLNTFLSLEPA